jgi:HAD superfamily hydrolase (TIGR01450 family)
LFKKIKAIAFDLDGTIYFGNRVADGAIDIVNYFKDKGIKIVYFTNNSVSTRQQVYLKLAEMGFDLKISDVYTSGYACALFVKELGLKYVYCLGSNGLKEELQNQMIYAVEDCNQVDGMVIGLDKQFNYQKLGRGLNMWRPGVRVIACNRDKNYPIENGQLMPGCGAIVAALECATGKTVDDIVGKPHVFMIKLVTRDLCLDHNSILVVGDTDESDIEMARRFGCPSVLVTNGSEIGNITTEKVCKLSQLKDLVQVC